METAETITSLSNQSIKRIRRLQEKTRARQKEKAFFVEGVPITLAAFESQASIETIVYCDSLLVSDRGRAALEQQRVARTNCIALSENVFRKVSQRNNPDGIGAICGTSWQDLRDIVPQASDVFVATEDLSDPGNLGTILRTMDATQANGLILVRKSTQPFHPRTVRASRGTVFTVPLSYSDNMDTVFEWAKKHQVYTVAASARAHRSFRDATYELPALLVFGNENRGLDESTMNATDQLVTIPMEGTNSSLNLSVAVSLMLYELKRAGRSST